MEKVNLYIENINRTHKPLIDKDRNINEVGKISYTILRNQKTVSIAELADRVAIKGNTAVLCTYREQYKTPVKSNEVSQQQVFALDFDNPENGIPFTYADAKADKFFQENAAFMYRTFSDSQSDVDKFRIIIVLDKPVNTGFKVQTIYCKLLEMYPQADDSVRSHERLIYGSNAGYEEINFNNRLNITDFLKGYTPDIKVSKPKKAQKKNLKVVSSTSSSVGSNKSYKGMVTKNYELFKSGDFKKLKNRYAKTYAKGHLSVNTAYNFFKNEVDMVEFLDLPSGNPFIDIFHDEENPSASIFRGETGADLYHVFSSNHNLTLDLVGVVAKLTKQSIFAATKLLVEITNGTFDISEEIKERQEFIRFIAKRIQDPDFNQLYPCSARVLQGNRRIIMAQMLEIMVENTYVDLGSGEQRLLSYLSAETMSIQIRHNTGNSYNLQTIKRMTNLMAYGGVIDKLPESDIPQDLLESLKEDQNSKNYARRVDVKELSSNEQMMEVFEERSTRLIDNEWTFTGLVFDWILNIFGEEEAVRVFPQHNRENTKVVSDFTNFIEGEAVKFIMYKIDTVGYVEDKEVMYYLLSNLKDREFSENKWKSMRKSIADKYGLRRGRLNMAIKDTLNLHHKYTKSQSPVVFTADVY